jgi:hypothetical protein
MGISIILTFAVLKLKLSDDVPAQSDYIPLFNIYYIGCMFVSLLSLLWFTIVSHYRANKDKIPIFVKHLVKKVICRIMCVKNYKFIKGERWINYVSDWWKSKTNFRFFSAEFEESIKELENVHDLSDGEVIEIMNDFVFWLFCFYVFMLNFGMLVVLPYFIKEPIVITDKRWRA